METPSNCQGSQLEAVETAKGLDSDKLDFKAIARTTTCSTGEEIGTAMNPIPVPLLEVGGVAWCKDLSQFLPTRRTQPFRIQRQFVRDTNGEEALCPEVGMCASEITSRVDGALQILLVD